jgi:hypothetical protein
MSQGFAQAHLQKASRCNNTASVSEVSNHLQGYFSEIEDPRVERSRAHELMDIVMISILAVIAGAKGWEDIETYGLSKQAWLGQFLALPNGIPCPDTFRRVFERIDPAAFEQCFQRSCECIGEPVGGTGDSD